MKQAVFSLCGTDFFPEEKGRVLWGKVHQLSAFWVDFFKPKGNFFVSFFQSIVCVNCGLIPLCSSGVREVHASLSSEVAALCSLEPRSKMSQKHPKDFAYCSCQGKYGLWNGNSETIHRVPGVIRKKRPCPSQYIQEWCRRENTHPHLALSLSLSHTHTHTHTCTHTTNGITVYKVGTVCVSKVFKGEVNRFYTWSPVTLSGGVLLC